MALAAAHIATAAFTFPKVSWRNRRTSLLPLLRSAASSGPQNSTKNEEVDARYVLKLGVGSVAGAAVIKYGSVIVPQVTKPNLSQALFIIITPVIAAASILLIRSKTHKTSA